MKEQGIESIPLYPEKRAYKAPTSDGILSAFLGLRRSQLFDQSGAIVRTFHDPKVASQFLKLLGVSTRAYLR